MSTKFTPGPWTVVPCIPDSQGRKRDLWSITAARGWVAKTCPVNSWSYGFTDAKVREANARLIAAAPELLEQLQLAREYLKERGIIWSGIEAALLKATGGAE